jgi:hypothetical protein
MREFIGRGDNSGAKNSAPARPRLAPVRSRQVQTDEIGETPSSPWLPPHRAGQSPRSCGGCKTTGELKNVA